MLLPKLLNKHHKNRCALNLSSNVQVNLVTISCMDAIVKCFCMAVHDGSTELKITLSSLLGYFISPLNSCDSSSGDRVWLVFTTSPANFDT